MGVPLAAVTRISEQVTAADFPGVSVEGVVSRSDDGMRVELLFTVERRDPSQIVLNLSRGEERTLERDLRVKLARALAAGY